MLGIRRINVAYRMLTTALLWKWRLHRLGRRCIIGRTRCVVNAGCLSIGDYSILWPEWSVVDLTPGTQVAQPKVKIGAHCRLHHNFQCNANESVEIRDCVVTAPRVFITDSNHVVDPSGERTSLCHDWISAPVVIENDCWLGVNAVVLKGVTLGHHSIVGANAVVTKSFPPYSILGGIPARRIGEVDHHGVKGPP